jgi:hypothetical protein
MPLINKKLTNKTVWVAKKFPRPFEALTTGGTSVFSSSSTFAQPLL